MFSGIELTIEAGSEGPQLVKTATDPAGRARLAEEADRLRRASHPGVVELLEHEGDRLVLAWAGGQTFATVTAPLSQAAGLLASVAATVGDLHELGIVHGALEPAHVVVGADGRPRVCGLGATGPDQSVGPADDVAAIGFLIDTLVGPGAELEPIPDRRWGRRSWSGYHRRALQMLADQATQEDPARRPTARALAAGIAEAVPDACLLPMRPTSALPGPTEHRPPVIEGVGTATIDSNGDVTAAETETDTETGDLESVTGCPTVPSEDRDHPPDAVAETPPVDTSASRIASPVFPEPGNEAPGGSVHGRRTDEADRPTTPARAPRIDVASAHGAAVREVAPEVDAEPREQVFLPPTLLGLRIEEAGAAPESPDGGPERGARAGVDRPIVASTRRRALVRVAVAVAASVVGALIIGSVAHRRAESDLSGPAPAVATRPDPTSPPPASDAVTDTSAPPSTLLGPVSSDGRPCASLSGPVADVDRDGCDEAIRVEGTTIVAGTRRFEVGVAGDQLAVGDWNCDGSATPAALRPSTGEVFVFASWGSPERPTTIGATTVIPGARSIETSTATACAPLIVHLADGATRTVTLPDGS